MNIHKQTFHCRGYEHDLNTAGRCTRVNGETGERCTRYNHKIGRKIYKHKGRHHAAVGILTGGAICEGAWK